MRRLLLFGLLSFLFAGSTTVLAQSGEPSVDVVVVDGPVDGRSIDFVIRAITTTDADLVVLQMDVGAVLGGEVDELTALLEDPPVPVAVWVGPDPAVAHGAAVQWLGAVAIRGAAPGVEIGWASPPIAGGPPLTTTDIDSRLLDGRITVTEPIPGLVDVVQPSIGQFVVGLDGTVAIVNGVPVTLRTATVENQDGVDVVKPIGQIRFVEEGIIDRLLHSANTPEVALFFLLAGLALAAFEFYAAGPGVAAAIAALLIMLAGYGLAVLPVWWPAVAATLVGIGLYLFEFQRNDLGWKSLLGTGLLLFGGIRLVDAGPQLVPQLWVVVVIVLGIALFFAFALTTVVRARFSTQTIGRDHLIGRVGVARGGIAPNGEVDVDGALWKARSTRQSGIGDGDQVVVVRIDGFVLEVDPVA